MSRTPVRIGIIGAGGIVRQRHLPGLRADPDVELVVVCNRSRESALAVSRDWNIPEVGEEWRCVVERPDLDAVLIGTWPYTHAEMSIAALVAGKHVFCQARMSRDVAEARRMVAAARAHPGQISMLCPPPMGMLGDRYVRRLIAEGYLGELREVHATGRSAMFADPAAPLHWRQDFDLQGFNTLTLGMWVEVIQRWVGRHSSVAAELRSFTPHRTDPTSGVSRGIRIADSVSISAVLASGALGTYHFSGVARHAPADVIELYGTEGTLRYDLASDLISLGRAGEAGAVTTVPRTERRPWTVEADFLRCIREGLKAEPDFEDGLAYMEVTEAVYRSAADGRRVSFPLP